MFRELAVVVSHKISAERSGNVNICLRSHSHSSSCFVNALNAIAVKSLVADAKLPLLAWHIGAGGVHVTSWYLIAAKLLSVAHFVEGSRRCRTNAARAIAWPTLVRTRRAPGARVVAVVPVAGVSGSGESVLGKGAVRGHRVADPWASLSFLVAVVVHWESTLRRWRLSVGLANGTILLCYIPPAETASLLLGKFVKYCRWLGFWFGTSLAGLPRATW